MKLHVDLGLQFVEHPPSLHTLPRQAAVALLAMLQSYRKKSIYVCTEPSEPPLCTLPNSDMIQESREHVVSMGHKMDTNTAGDPDPQSIERLEEVVSALDSPDQHIEDIAVSAILACYASRKRLRLGFSLRVAYLEKIPNPSMQVTLCTYMQKKGSTLSRVTFRRK